MNKDKIIKDLKERNDKLANQYRLRDIRCVHLEIENADLKEQVEELKHIMYVIRDDNGLNHLWCKDMILDWLGSDVK